MKQKLHFKIINLSLLFLFEICFSQASLVKDMYVGSGSGNPLYITKIQTTAVFNGSKSGTVGELWITDGTESGTQLLKDINLGSAVSNPQNLTKVNNLVFFKADNGTVGTELWVTDGSESGTFLVKDISSGAATSGPNNLINVNGTLFFTANTDLFNKDQLWKSDGTEAGTVLVKNLRPDSTFNANTSSLTPTSDGKLFFITNDGVHGSELWISNGTEEGTYLVKDIKTGTSGAQIGNLTAVGNEVFFSALGDSGIVSLWKSDGTDIGTIMVEPNLSFYSLANYNTTAVYDGNFYFVANNYYNDSDNTTGKELWVSDGTMAGTTILKDISAGINSSNPNNFIVYNNLLYFRATQSSTGEELWVTDGTPEGTERVIDINPGSSSSSPNQFTIIGNELYFVANDGVYGQELWKTDGTPEGTVRLTDIKPGSACCSNVQYITEVNNIILFRADDGISGYEIWRLDQEALSVEKLSSQPFKVYPNPTSNILNITAAFSDTFDITIYDQFGQKVLKQKQNSSSVKLETNNLSKGLYFLNINSENGKSQNIKFIKN